MALYGSGLYGGIQFGASQNPRSRLYGSFKYGGLAVGGMKYGASTVDTLRWGLEIDWDGDGAFTGANEAGRLKAFSLTRGRPRLLSSGEGGQGKFSRMQPGELTLTLDNYDRRYDPWYVSSPLYPNVQPGREVRLRVRDGRVTTVYDIFRGRIDTPSFEGYQGEAKATLACADGWRQLLDRNSTIALQTGVTTDVVISAVLDDVAWPSAWGRNLAVGSDTIPYAWVDDQSAYDAIHDLIESEMGLATVEADGQFRFRSRTEVEGQSASLALNQTQVGKDLVVGQPWDLVRNKIKVTAYPRVLGSLGTIWQLQEKRLVGAGVTVVIWGTFVDSNNSQTIAQDVVSPQATTDYTMNTQADGGGADLTAQFTVSASIFAGSVKLTITNGSASPGYITLLKIRGKPLELLQVSANVSENSASQATYGVRQLKLDLPFQQSTKVAADLGDWLLSWMKDPLPEVTVELVDQPTIQFAYDVGDIVVFSSTYFGINHRFRIGQIRHESMETMQAIRTLWALEPVGDLVTYWLLGTSGKTEIGITTRLGY